MEFPQPEAVLEVDLGDGFFGRKNGGGGNGSSLGMGIGGDIDVDVEEVNIVLNC